MKRRFFALGIALILVLIMFPSVASAYDGWDGSVDTSWYSGGSPYTIDTAEGLAGLAALVNGGNDFSGQTVLLGDNLNLGGHEWTPIGNASHPFNGTFGGG